MSSRHDRGDLRRRAWEDDGAGLPRCGATGAVLPVGAQDVAVDDDVAVVEDSSSRREDAILPGHDRSALNIDRRTLPASSRTGSSTNS